mgnify:CR=1 FL=1
MTSVKTIHKHLTFRNQLRKRGFSLIEVLVAMTILSVIVLIVAGIFQQTGLAWSLGLRRADEQSMIRARGAEGHRAASAHPLQVGSVGYDRHARLRDQAQNHTQ